MKKLGSYGIYLTLLLPLLGASIACAQDDVDSSALRDQRETNRLIDDLPSRDAPLGEAIDRHHTISSGTLLARAPDTAGRGQIEWTSEVGGEQKLGVSSDENTDFNKFTTEGSCLQSGKAGTRWRCFFSNPDTGFVAPKRFTPSHGDESDDSDAKSPPLERFHWKPAIVQSLLIQGFQHGYALAAQEKMRRALKGPFFKDYINSLKGLAGWDDGNRFFTNYVAHPAQGGMTGFIFVQNHDRVKKQKFAESKQYWKDRLSALVWSTAWSTNWELGPISQSSIGNLGLKGGMGYVDLVITPTVGTVWLISEEAIDRYIIRHIEKKNFLFKIAVRIFLNPMRSVANALRFKEPWYRDRPFGH